MWTFVHTISHKPTTGQSIISHLCTGIQAEARDFQILKGEPLDSNQGAHIPAHIPASSYRVWDRKEVISEYVKAQSDKEYKKVDTSGWLVFNNWSYFDIISSHGESWNFFNGKNLPRTLTKCDPIYYPGSWLKCRSLCPISDRLNQNLGVGWGGAAGVGTLH